MEGLRQEEEEDEMLIGDRVAVRRVLGQMTQRDEHLKINSHTRILSGTSPPQPTGV